MTKTTNKEGEKLKRFFLLIIVLADLYGGIWLFNHVNGWLGICVILVGLYIIAKFIVSFIKNHKKDEEN